MLNYFKNIKQNFKAKHYLNYVAVTAFLLVFMILFYTGNLKRSMSTLLVQIGCSIILAVSLNLVVGFLGELSLGHAGFMCIGAYLGTFIGNSMVNVVQSRLLRLIICILIGGFVAAVFGLIVGLPALRLKGDYLAIVTLAFGEIVRNLCKNMPFLGGEMGLESTAYGPSLFIPTFIIVLLMLISIQNLIRSKHGRAITAIRDNEIAAKSMGVNVTYYKLLAFTVSAFFAGVAGVIYGRYVSLIKYDNFSYNYSIEILVMVVLGGMGSVNGSIIAASVITFINFLLTTKLSGDLAAFKFLIYALILIFMVVYKNAPSLKKYRDKFSFRVIADKVKVKLRKNKNLAGDIEDDEAAWDRVPTKITTDEILSTDLSLSNYNPDKPDKPKGENQ